ncbi:MAG: TIGR03619 family F420-dependent LLM class oxidoreductase [Rhodospirillaceae bacterium]|nr:MAG: TIGR03619 family F420-dependent LLM class oxidoreductase [Rhodospirillaceae bacterium]
MKIGISANFVWFGPPITELAKAIEAFGFESLWTGEHIIIPVDIANPVRHGVTLPENYKHMPDVFVSMAAAATATTTLKFGMDVCLVTQRNPLVLAKEAATLDHVSRGRLIIGVGYGWIEEESAIMGVPFKQRVRKSTEVVRALKTLWTEEKPSFSGEFFSFPPVYSYPKPFQKPHIPMLIGSGNHNTDNTRALKRVAEIADGWVPAFLSPNQMKDQLRQLKEYCDAAGRDFDAMDISLIVPAINLGVGDRPAFFAGLEETPKDAAQLIGEYEEAGVKRIIVGMNDMTDESSFKALEKAAKGLGLS